LIVFLCPNGHRLNGPASLEGKAGQCPHCGVKFRVPSRDDPPEEEEEEPLPAINTGPGSGSGIQSVDTVEEYPPEEPTYNLNIEEIGGSSATRGQSGGAAPGNVIGRSQASLGEVFARLWNERERGSVVEIHLATGQVLLPEKYAKDVTNRPYGLFAIKDPDGTYTIAAIHWDAVTRVCLRHLPKLPKKMFD
jgi:hypothetical protein